MIEIVLLVLALLLVLACGGFVAAEFAFVTINRSAVEAAAADGDRKAKQVLAALRTLSTQLSGAQLGITVTNLTIGYLAEPSLSRLIQPSLLDVGLNETAARSVSLTLAMVIATGVTMILGELMPKNLAIADPMRVARAVVNFQRAFTWINTWPIRLFNGSANRILRMVGIQPRRSSPRPGRPRSSLPWCGTRRTRARSPRTLPSWWSGPWCSPTGAPGTR